MRAIQRIIKSRKMSIYRLSKLIRQSYQRTQYIVEKKNFSQDYKVLEDISNALDCSIEDLIDEPNN